MRSDETISVIIPVYKVEKYLNRCIESVVKQTYVKMVAYQMQEMLE